MHETLLTNASEITLIFCGVTVPENLNSFESLNAKNQLESKEHDIAIFMTFSIV